MIIILCNEHVWQSVMCVSTELPPWSKHCFAAQLASPFLLLYPASVRSREEAL